MTDNGTTTTSTVVVNANQARSALLSSGGTMYFNHDRTGIGDVSPGNKAFSVSAWYQRSAASGINVIAAVSEASNIEWRLYWAQGGTQDVAAFLISYNGTATNAVMADTSTGGAGTTPTNTWFHVVGTWNPNSNVIAVYSNGVLGQTSAKTSNVGFQGTAQFGIGANVTGAGAPSAHWNGKLSNIGFWNRCLTAQEVSYIYNQNRTWPFVRPM
jgi:hypothetical protein